MTVPKPPSWPALLVRLLAGSAVLAAGLAAGRALLPAGRVGELPPRESYVDSFREVARRHGVSLDPGAPRVRLDTGEQANTVARRLLGAAANEWLVRHGRGLAVEVSQGAQWGVPQGRLTITFSATREPWSASWNPTSAPGFFSPSAAQPDAICALLLGRGESQAKDGVTSTAQGSVTSLVTIAGAPEPQHLQMVDPSGATVACSRCPGNPAAASRDLARHGFGAGWVRLIAPLALAVFAVGLFAALALRARVDLWNGAALAGAFLVTTLAGDWPVSISDVIVQVVATPATAVWLLLLWAGAESWARAHVPDFTTTLDTLRRGRLGARGGRELLTGWSLGAGIAGVRLATLAVAVPLPGVDPAGGAASLPLFALGGHPLRRAMIWVASLLLVATLGEKVSRRWGAALALLAVPLVLAPVRLSPWLAEYAVGVLLGVVLFVALRRAGLTTALVAALLGFLLPTAALALRYAAWMPVTAVVATVVALAPLVAGVLGVARGEAVERDPGAVPEFVRRGERERRLSYEMDLLARMQLGLLPQSLPNLPGYEITARSVLATEAGGDLYDFLRDERGRLWIAAGDVSGHGYSCAIGQASVKASLLSLVDGNANPARILDRVDRVIRDSSLGGRQFATLCLACLEVATGRLLISNAGHPFPILAAPQQPPRELEMPGLPLGQGPPRRYRDLEVTIPKGGVLLFYSDGLYEATDPNGNPYGFDRPQRVLADAAAWNAAEVLERLIFDWRRHLAGAAPADDTTLVVLKRV